ncbi:hypothetical protein NIIDNTM18_43030 [Mycolicibacterium litorale]|uniref:Uncharacterized protein n=1 Tax=Mycolicibacterium litorale TaxID=758802 RepID=A0A6S6P931_9MYCO|nr:hypothetical protein NIIDNTM18_43030 [Mycolicibacterium litorale]
MTTQPNNRRDSVNKIFGETLPEASADERDDASSVEEARHDQWLRDNIPPHHD